MGLLAHQLIIQATELLNLAVLVPVALSTSSARLAAGAPLVLERALLKLVLKLKPSRVEACTMTASPDLPVRHKVVPRDPEQDQNCHNEFMCDLALKRCLL